MATTNATKPADSTSIKLCKLPGGRQHLYYRESDGLMTVGAKGKPVQIIDVLKPLPKSDRRKVRKALAQMQFTGLAAAR